LAVERRLVEFHRLADGGGGEQRPAVDRPRWCVAAAAVEVERVEELDDAPVTVAVGERLQARAVGPDDVRVAVLAGC